MTRKTAQRVANRKRLARIYCPVLSRWQGKNNRRLVRIPCSLPSRRSLLARPRGGAESPTGRGIEGDDPDALETLTSKDMIDATAVGEGRGEDAEDRRIEG